MIVNNSVEVEEQESGTYVFPAIQGKRGQGWSLYIFTDGSAQLYLKCKPDGVLLGKPIRLPAPTEIVNPK